jgi:hypothetical protein
LPTYGIGCTLGLVGFSSFIRSGSQGDGVRGKAGGTHLRGIMSPVVRQALMGLVPSVGSEARAQTPAGRSVPAFRRSLPTAYPTYLQSPLDRGDSDRQRLAVVALRIALQ